MDRYACVLEQLRADDFRRLRRYVADGRSEFSTWLVVVAQRICLDQHRHHYGRNRSGGERGQGPGEDERVARRRLVDLLGAEVDLASIADGGAATPEEALRAGEIYGELENLLERLGPRDRLLVKLRFEDDLTVQEIVRSLGFPTRFHVYRRLSYVLERLRYELQRKGITDPVP
jgi:RNA polymerase sigma factor (sigma-70 family)